MQPPPGEQWGWEIVKLPGCPGGQEKKKREKGGRSSTAVLQSTPRYRRVAPGSFTRAMALEAGPRGKTSSDIEGRKGRGRKEETWPWDESASQTSRGTLASDFRIQRSRGTRRGRESTAPSTGQGGAAGGGRKEKGGRREHGRVIPLRSRAYLWRVGAKPEEIVRDWRKGRGGKCGRGLGNPPARPSTRRACKSLPTTRMARALRFRSNLPRDTPPLWLPNYSREVRPSIRRSRA